jgi:hypothetical protein
MDSFLAQPSTNPVTNPVIDLDPDDNTQSELTSLYSGDTPTLPGDELSTIRALDKAVTNAKYKLCLGQIPRDHRIKVRGIPFV